MSILKAGEQRSYNAEVKWQEERKSSRVKYIGEFLKKSSNFTYKNANTSRTAIKIDNLRKAAPRQTMETRPSSNVPLKVRKDLFKNSNILGQIRDILNGEEEPIDEKEEVREKPSVKVANGAKLSFRKRISNASRKVFGILFRSAQR